MFTENLGSEWKLARLTSAVDHLGSVAVVMNQSGAVVERLAYGAWGKRRNLDGSDAACGAISSSTTRIR